MPITGLDVLLQLDPRRLERLKRDWHAFTTVTLHDFVFLLSRHAAGVELSRHPQSQLLAAIVGLFHEIESCSSTEGSVDWAGMQTQLMHAAKSVTTTTTTADCPEYPLAPLLVHERGADVHVDAAAAAAARRAQAAAKAHAEAYAHAATPINSFGFIAGRAAETQAAEEAAEAAARGGTRMAPSVGTVEALQLIEAPVDRLLVCDVRGERAQRSCRRSPHAMAAAAAPPRAAARCACRSRCRRRAGARPRRARRPPTSGVRRGDARVTSTPTAMTWNALVRRCSLRTSRASTSSPLSAVASAGRCDAGRAAALDAVVARVELAELPCPVARLVDLVLGKIAEQPSVAGSGRRPWVGLEARRARRLGEEDGHRHGRPSDNRAPGR